MTTKNNRRLIRLALLGAFVLALVVAYRALNLNNSAGGPKTTPEPPKPTATEITQGYPAPSAEQLAALPPTGYPGISAANMTQAAALAQLQVTVHATANSNPSPEMTAYARTQMAQAATQIAAHAPTAFPVGQAHRHEIPGRFGLQIPVGWYATDNEQNVIYVSNYDQTKINEGQLPPGSLKMLVAVDTFEPGQTLDQFVSNFIANITQQPSFPSVSKPEPYSFGRYTGVSFFTKSAQHSSKRIVLSLENNQYLMVALSPSDDSPAMKQALEILATLTIP